jgi:Lipoprotein LpqB beta-propeller domain/Sporulation and spore germination
MSAFSGRPTRAAGVVAAVLVGGILLASCAQVPRHGTVQEVQQGQRQAPQQGEFFLPKGPDAGDRPADIVSGFLTAMTAVPLNPHPALAYLSAAARAQWEPQRVITYGVNPLPRGVRHVVVRLRHADGVGARGQWQGSLPTAARRLVFPMVRENGEWRIARVPNAYILPSDFYDQAYQPGNIYFFDPSGRILVPEPVHVPGAQQLASSLVKALVSGPGRALAGVVRSYVPPGLDAVSVPVTDGVAEVTLRGPDPGALSRKATQLILAQLTWTLRQDPSIQSFRLSIDGRPVTDATGAQSFRIGVANNDPYDPADSRATSVFYALRKGRLVSGQIGHPTPVEGPFGKVQLGVGPFAVSLDNLNVAGVTTNSLLVGSVNEPSQAIPVVEGTGFLRPAWDFAGRLWDVQNTSEGARVLYIQGGHAHRVRVPGVTGENVRRFLVSRDGSRLVAVIRGHTTDRIVVSRLRYVGADVAHRATRARRLPWTSTATKRVRDIGWISPTTIEVLDQISSKQAEFRILGVDGSTSPDETTVTPIPDRTLGLVTSPVSDQTPYAVLRHQLYDLGQGDSARSLSPPTIDIPKLRYVTYAG